MLMMMIMATELCNLVIRSNNIQKKWLKRTRQNKQTLVKLMFSFTSTLYMNIKRKVNNNKKTVMITLTFKFKTSNFINFKFQEQKNHYIFFKLKNKPRVITMRVFFLSLTVLVCQTNHWSWWWWWWCTLLMFTQIFFPIEKKNKLCKTSSTRISIRKKK